MATPKQIKRLTDRLIVVAKASRTIAYSQVDHLVGLDVVNYPVHRRLLGEILARIGTAEVNAGRPFLAAVVIRKGKGRRHPGPGFYPQARMQKRYRKFYKLSDPKFHTAILNDVHYYW